MKRCLPILAFCVAATALIAGTIEIPNARLIDERLLLGGQPTEAQLTEMAEAGYVRIVNLRGPGENGSIENERELVESLGMEYVAIPIASGNDFSAEAIQALQKATADSDEKVVVHCASGNRVGVLFALKAFKLDGLSADAAKELGAAYGMRGMPAQVEEQLKAD